MLKKKKDPEDDSTAKEIDPAVVVKFEKPKILLVDLKSEVCSKIKSAGYNVASGTFGSPYKVELDDGYGPIINAAKLPNFTEQEIIIIDLTPPKTLEKPVGEKNLSAGGNGSGCRSWVSKRSRPKLILVPALLRWMLPPVKLS